MPRSSVTVTAAEIVGLKGVPISVEVDLAQGLHRFTVVGLPDKAVEESKERISAAIKNTGFKPPHRKNNRVTISLAPADLKKEGPLFDLAMSLGFLLASRQVSFDPANRMFLGELALDGSLRKSRGVLALALAAKEADIKELYVPSGNGKEAALVHGLSVFECTSLEELIAHLEEQTPLAALAPTRFEDMQKPSTAAVDFADIVGQESAKRGLEIAAAGRHHVALFGPPGTGKTLLARAFSALLPPLSFEEAMEVTTIHSIAGLLHEAVITHRPFRSPHHTSSYPALVGGGSIPRPGEVTLAHRGVLFLDEFPEFDRNVIEALRQPLEDRVVSVSRVKATSTFPAQFVLVAAMNACPCGRRGSQQECTCRPAELARYERRLSGPLVDRIDIWLNVPQVEHRLLALSTIEGAAQTIQKNRGSAEPSQAIQKRVAEAHAIQAERFGGTSLRANSEMGIKEIKRYCMLAPAARHQFEHAARQLDLSARAYHRVLKVSRTIADLAGLDTIQESHIMETLQYRPTKL
ncbi:MAG: YifB family Mg chelatase-like AAA ATPase [Patescibacteria group bacterium]